MSQCKICSSPTILSFTATVLRKHLVEYRHCPNCGFLQTQEPHWLEEAYSSAISDADTGLVYRNLRIASKLTPLLFFRFDRSAAYLDISGGYGLLTRLMRDLGFDYYWDDPYCRNLLARGFEATASTKKFHALSAFEVLEHLHDPMAFIKEQMDRYQCKNLIFSTELYPGNPPPSRDWHYYAFNTGQHVSFFQERTLAKMATQLGLHFSSFNGVHLLTESSIAAPAFVKLATGKLAPAFALYARRKMESKIMADHDKMLGISSSTRS